MSRGFYGRLQEDEDGFYNGTILIRRGWRLKIRRFRMATWRDIINTINAGLDLDGTALKYNSETGRWDPAQ